jgi:lipoprotein-anchoring transpeptidase ErfK/SrfK
MPRDYDPVLRRAIAALDFNTAESRGAVYDRARHAVMQSRLPAAEIGKDQAALEAAIARIEPEMQRTPAWRDRRSSMPAAAPQGPADGAARAPPPVGKAISWRIIAALAAPILLVAIVALYAFWPRSVDRDRAAKREEAVAARVEDARSGNRSSDPTRSYIFNRQMVYYRTVHPVGTIVIAKSQRFLYLVRSNTSAIRYTTGVGRECANTAGLLLISAKDQWSEQPPQPGTSSQRPSGRFGARALALADTGHHIHGTPTTASEDGCFPLVNDDIVDLYDRVPVGTRVVIN